MGENTDHSLMSAVRDGDLDKLGYLFEKYHKQLYNFFLRQVRDQQSCEDMVQEVFLKMLKYRHTYRGKGKFTTWLNRITVNECSKKHKKRQIASLSLEKGENRGLCPDNPAELPEDIMIRKGKI